MAKADSNPKARSGNLVIVVLLMAAFLVGMVLFAYLLFQFFASPGGREVAQAATATRSIASPTPTPTSTPVPTRDRTSVPTAAPATSTPMPATPTPAGSQTSAGSGNLPDTGLGLNAPLVALLLSSVAVGARWLRRRR